jgi:hypothetical protein
MEAVSAADSTVCGLPPGDWATWAGGLATALALLVTSALFLLQRATDGENKTLPTLLLPDMG